MAGGAISAYAIEYNERRLAPRLEGEYLHVSAPNFTFLTGRSLERLKDGASVAFVAQLIVSTTPNYVVADARAVARYAVSEDIWEERFSVTRITDRADQKLTKSHLSAPAAESWCLDNLVVNRSELPAVDLSTSPRFACGRPARSEWLHWRVRHQHRQHPALGGNFPAGPCGKQDRWAHLDRWPHPS